MVQFCRIQKYSFDKPDVYFMFYDTISDMPIFFNDEFMFSDEEEFKFYLQGSPGEKEADRYLGKITEEFKKNANQRI